MSRIVSSKYQGQVQVILELLDPTYLCIFDWLSKGNLEIF